MRGGGGKLSLIVVMNCLVVIQYHHHIQERLSLDANLYAFKMPEVDNLKGVIYGFVDRGVQQILVGICTIPH